MSGRSSSAGAPRKTAVDRAVEGVHERLLSGDYAPGQRLVEADLVRDLGVGRNAVREALARLSSEGVVTIEPHRGASVRRLDEADLEDFYAVRAVLEGLAARLAASRIGEPGHAAKLRAARDAMRRAADVGNVAGYMDENLRFHACVVDLAGSPRLDEMVGMLHLKLFRLRFPREGFEELLAFSPSEHDAIASAILRGDGDAAEAVMREHIQHTADQARRMLARSSSRSPHDRRRRPTASRPWHVVSAHVVVTHVVVAHYRGPGRRLASRAVRR